MELTPPSEEPNARADALLRGHLSEEQWRMYQATGTFAEGDYVVDTRSSSHGFYARGDWVCATLIDPKRRSPASPFPWLPPGDIGLAFLLLIRTRPATVAGWFGERINVRHKDLGMLLCLPV